MFGIKGGGYGAEVEGVVKRRWGVRGWTRKMRERGARPEWGVRSGSHRKCGRESSGSGSFGASPQGS